MIFLSLIQSQKQSCAQFSEMWINQWSPHVIFQGRQACNKTVHGFKWLGYLMVRSCSRNMSLEDHKYGFGNFRALFLVKKFRSKNYGKSKDHNITMGNKNISSNNYLEIKENCMTSQNIKLYVVFACFKNNIITIIRI